MKLCGTSRYQLLRAGAYTRSESPDGTDGLESRKLSCMKARPLQRDADGGDLAKPPKHLILDKTMFQSRPCLADLFATQTKIPLFVFWEPTPKKRSCSKSYILYILQKKRGLSLKKCFRKSENASKFAKYLEYENPYSIFKISCSVLISIPNECPGFSRHSLGHSLNRKMYEKK